jgi:Leucine-rich repeat (LRR) protein
LIDGIAMFPNLSEIYLAHNLIEDLTPLSDLKKIAKLDLSFNLIKDISHLNNCISI